MSDDYRDEAEREEAPAIRPLHNGMVYPDEPDEPTESSQDQDQPGTVPEPPAHPAEYHSANPRPSEDAAAPKSSPTEITGLRKAVEDSLESALKDRLGIDDLKAHTRKLRESVGKLRDQGDEPSAKHLETTLDFIDYSYDVHFEKIQDQIEQLLASLVLNLRTAADVAEQVAPKPQD